MYSGTLQAVSNREDWVFFLSVFDADAGELRDLTDATIKIAVRAGENQATVLSAVTGDEHISVGTTSATVLFPRSEMVALCPGEYNVGITAEFTGITVQLLSGTLPVIDGVVDA